MKREKIFKYAWQAILAIFLLIISFGITKALFRPGPRQLEKTFDEKINLEEKVMRAREARTELLQQELKRLPPFKPPENNIISPDQMERYVNIIYYMNKIQEENVKRRPKYDLNLSGALYLARREMTLVNLVEVEQLLKYKMNYDEYNWIGTKAKKALALAMKRLSENCYGPEKPPELKENFDDAMILGHYTAPDEQNNLRPKPELLDPSEIPEANYRNVVSYYKWLKYQGIDLEKVNMQCLIDRDKIQPADYRPPGVIYPEIKSR